MVRRNKYVTCENYMEIKQGEIVVGEEILVTTEITWKSYCMRKMNGTVWLKLVWWKVVRAILTEEWKGRGQSGVVGEMMKGAGNTDVWWITKLCYKVLKDCRIPNDWKSSTLVPIFMGESVLLMCRSYKGKMVLEHGLKVQERLLETNCKYQQGTVQDHARARDPRRNICEASGNGKEEAVPWACEVIESIW